MNQETKYYRVAITDPFVDNGERYIVFAALENGNYFEILTNKKIYILNNNIISVDVFKDDFYNKECSLIGIFKKECDESIISKYLRFSLPARKEEIIENINKIEESIKSSLGKNKEKVLK